jgi:hypothetical protein
VISHELAWYADNDEDDHFWILNAGFVEVPLRRGYEVKVYFGGVSPVSLQDAVGRG